MTVAQTRNAITRVVTASGGRCLDTVGRHTSWRVPTPHGDVFIEITLRPRWCSVGFDRIRSTEYPEPASRWLKYHIWPLVQAAVRVRGGWGTLPNGHGHYTQAWPIERSDVPGVVERWLRHERTGWVSAGVEVPQ